MPENTNPKPSPSPADPTEPVPVTSDPAAPSAGTSPLATEPGAPAQAVPLLRLRAAFEEIQAEAALLKPDEYVKVNLDVVASAVAVQGNLVKIMPFKAQLLLLPFFRKEAIERLETYAFAARHSQTRVQSASDKASPQDRIDAMGKVRERLMYDLMGFVHHNRIDGAALAALKGPFSKLDICQHAIVMVDVAKKNYPAFGGKFHYTLEQLHAIEIEADAIMTDIGIKAQNRPVDATVLEDRARAFTLLQRAYEEVRRGLTYLRWYQEDVDRIAPSLWTGRGGRGRKQEGEPDAPDAPAPVPGAAPVPVVGPNGAPLPAGQGMPGDQPLD